MDETLTDTTTSGQSGPGSNGNHEQLPVPQSSMTGTTSSDGLESYLGHSLLMVGRSYCYITYDMDFRFVPSDPVCFDKLTRCNE